MMRFDVDAGGRCERPVVGDCPHRLAGPAAQQQDADRREDDHADAHGPEVAGGDVERSDVDSRAHGVVVVGLGAPGVEVEEQVAQEQRQADRDDEGSNQPRPAPAQRPPQPQFEGAARQPPGDDGEDRGDDQLHADLDVEEERGERSKGHQLPVGEVRQLRRAVDQ